MKKIPVLGTQSLNSFTNLKKLINSIDYPVETLSIIINSENLNYFLDIKNFCDQEVDKNLIDRVDISFHPTNLGCPASWNYHFKSYPYAEFFVKPDDDIVFCPGDLEKIVNALEAHDMVFYSHNTGYACFGITKNTLKTVGLFDENMYPCNYEDDDYQRRINIYEISTVCLGLDTYHASSGTSANITPEEHAEYLGKYIVTTEEYFHKKWHGQFGDPLKWCYNFDYRENKIFRYKNYH